MNNELCPKCNSQMDQGRVPKPLTWFSGYKSDSQKHFSFEVNIEKAKACLNCGYLEFYINPDKLKEKV
jgi:predicted nucleic-acid-binding Zn-ribbon protein